MREMMTFVSVGMVSFVIDFSAYAILTRGTQIYFLLANALSFTAAVTVSFLLNRRFTFPHGHRGGAGQYMKFVGVAVVGLALNTFFLWLLVVSFGIHDFIAKFAAAVIVFLWNFSAQRYWTFRVGRVYTND